MILFITFISFLFYLKEEREGKKKLLPRTRSGRVSKPPRHMVKDYKRLHHLDFAQPDLDDSDGGYSDYRVDAKAASQRRGGNRNDESDEEEDEDEEESTADEGGSTNVRMKASALGLRATSSRSLLQPNVARKASPIPTSPFHCTTCKKEYTTPNRLSRHFEQFPDHSSSLAPLIAAAAKKASVDAEVKTEATESNGNGEDHDESMAVAGEGNEGEDQVAVKTTTPGRGRGGWRGRGGRGRGGRGRGRPGRPPLPHSPALLAEKRKVKLAEVGIFVQSIN